MPTTRIRRFVDVVFVEPKHKQYIILHQGEFWQLPRMHLTQNSWELRTPYTGSLNDIFVAQNQGISCQELEATLTTYELPEQLAGLSATHFLSWWSNNDYKWLSQKNVVNLGDDTDNDLVLDFSTSTLAPTPKPAQNPPKNSASTQVVQQPIPQSTKPNTPSTTQVSPKAQSAQAPQVADKTQTNGFNIFDDLLQELNNEVLYPNR